ncbi:MAG: hypothetical protein WBA97_31075 [Actinophytocola sp.]|uniref:hypothetical protein n=1 Tax=Actinophytocola sp. TaxID=1872138 RepID=UPI003C7247E1
MAPIVAGMVDQDEVEAVCILSSSAVNGQVQTPFDEESDFDIAVVLDIPLEPSQWHPRPRDTYALIVDKIPNWVPPFLFYVDVPWGRMEVNVNQLIYQYELDTRTTWNGEKCEVYTRKAEVVFDRNGAFAKLVGNKVSRTREALLIERQRLANRITWDIREMSLRQAKRCGPTVGHHVLNLAIEEVIDLVFLARGRFIPNRKWKLQQLAEIVDSEALKRIHEALRTDLSQSDLVRRVEELERFCDSVGLVYDGPAAADARSDYQALIQLRPAPTWRDIETFGARSHERMPPSIPAPRTLDQLSWITQRNPT